MTTAQQQKGLMTRVLAAAFASMFVTALLAQGAAGKTHRGKPILVKVVTSAESAGAIATATPTCPQSTPSKKPGRRLGPWRAVSGGFEMGLGRWSYSPDTGTATLIRSGDGVVHESRKVGQRSWRVSAQNLWGRITLTAYVNCQRGMPKTKEASSTVVTSGTPQVGPETVATCTSGQTVSGGFSTPPPFTPTGAANTVIASIPSGRKGWRAEVVSSEASSLTSYVYCAKRKRARLLRSLPSPESVATLADSEAVTYASGLGGKSCPTKKRKKPADYPGATEAFGEFVPGAGGFSQQGATPTQYLVPTFVRSAPFEWRVSALKVGSGTPVSLNAVTLCG